MTLNCKTLETSVSMRAVFTFFERRLQAFASITLEG